jgi:hypothetical protein
MHACLHGAPYTFRRFRDQCQVWLPAQVGKELELRVVRPGSSAQLTLHVVALEAPSS